MPRSLFLPRTKSARMNGAEKKKKGDASLFQRLSLTRMDAPIGADGLCRPPASCHAARQPPGGRVLHRRRPPHLSRVAQGLLRRACGGNPGLLPDDQSCSPDRGARQRGRPAPRAEAAAHALCTADQSQPRLAWTRMAGPVLLLAPGRALSVGGAALRRAQSGPRPHGSPGRDLRPALPPIAGGAPTRC